MFNEVSWLALLALLLLFMFNKRALQWLMARIQKGSHLTAVCVCGGEIRCTGENPVPEGVMRTYTCRGCGRYKRYLE